MADFAPYQDTSPDTTRALSPPTSPLGAPPNAWGSGSPWNSPPARSSPKPPRGQSTGGLSHSFAGDTTYEPIGDVERDVERDVGRGGQGGRGGRGGREALNEFETSLPLRLDYEACAAYLLLPPVGGVLLLITEWKSDYVRFHAWQSALLFSFLFFIHLLFVWSRFLSWVIFLVDLGLIAYLTMRAYLDADTLDRYEVPFFGPLASRFVDDE